MNTLTTFCVLLCVGVAFSASLPGSEIIKDEQARVEIEPVAVENESLEPQESHWRGGWGGHHGHHGHHGFGGYGGYGGYGGFGGYGGGFGGWGGRGFGYGGYGGYGGWGGGYGWGR